MAIAPSMNRRLTLTGNAFVSKHKWIGKLQVDWQVDTS